jgi:hypothetical protein
MNTMWMQRWAATAVLAACAGWSQAGTVSLTMAPVSPLNVGDTVTFTIGDTRPRDMWVVDPGDPTLGVAAGDFSLLYDLAALEFVSVVYPDWITLAASTFAFDNGTGPPDGEVLVTVSGFDEFELPETADQLFQVTFTVKSAGEVRLAPSLPPSYEFAPQQLGFDVNRTVPVPPTGTLLLLGLLGVAVARRSAKAPCPGHC